MYLIHRRFTGQCRPFHYLALFGALVAFGVSAQDAARQEGPAGVPRVPTITERGPHHRVWERTTNEVLPDGSTVERKHSYTELATGLHYQNDLGEWVESKEEIELFQGAALARQGQHQVTFAANLNSPGAIDLLTPDKKRFRSHVVGLVYTDAASGRSVFIAETKDCVGAVLPPNQVIYQDAFAGDCQADVRYTYTKAGFEQDIILLNAPPSPTEWGLNPETTRLEVFTEFIEAPQGVATPVILKQQSNPVFRQQMVEPDLIDQRLDFGVMKMETGQAFPLGSTEIADESRVETGKSLTLIDGRLFLIEKVDYSSIRKHLQQLPQAAAINKNRKVGKISQMAGLLPVRPKGVRGQWRDKQVARADLPRTGLVLDYIAVNGSLTNYTFKGDSTYHITSSPSFYGTTVIEGGAVLKYNAGLQATAFGPVDCRTSAYRPAFFTSKDDDTVGDIIAGSTGNPTNYGHIGVAFNFRDTSAPYDLHDLRIFYALHGVAFYSGTRSEIQNVIIGKSCRALVWVGVVAGTSFEIPRGSCPPVKCYFGANVKKDGVFFGFSLDF